MESDWINQNADIGGLSIPMGAIYFTVMYSLVAWCFSIVKIREWCQHDIDRINAPNYMFRGGDEPLLTRSFAIPLFVFSPVWLVFWCIGMVVSFITALITGGK